VSTSFTSSSSSTTSIEAIRRIAASTAYEPTTGPANGAVQLEECDTKTGARCIVRVKYPGAPGLWPSSFVLSLQFTPLGDVAGPSIDLFESKSSEQVVDLVNACAAYVKKKKVRKEAINDLRNLFASIQQPPPVVTATTVEVRHIVCFFVICVLC